MEETAADSQERLGHSLRPQHGGGQALHGSHQATRSTLQKFAQASRAHDAWGKLGAIAAPDPGPARRE
jgi:hypothetical protein